MEFHYNKAMPAYTFPSDNSEKKIDYVLYSPHNRWKIYETKVICDEIASDHFAYLAVLELLSE